MKLNIGNIVTPATIGIVKNGPDTSANKPAPLPGLNDMAAVAKQRDALRQEEAERSQRRN